MRRVRAGWCEVANPFRPSQARRVSLAPEDVKAIFFWTRYPAPMLPHLPELARMGHRFVFHVTLTGYPPATLSSSARARGSPIGVVEVHAVSSRAADPGGAPPCIELPTLEPFPVPMAARVAAIRDLARAIGPERVWWRYDPIVLADSLTPAWHLENFGRLADALAGSTVRVTFSLLDWYRKTERRLRSVVGVPPLREPRGARASSGPWAQRADGTEPHVQALVERNDGTEPHVQALVAKLAEIAAAHGIRAVSCCEEVLASSGVGPGACMDGSAAAGVTPGACIDGVAAAELFGIDAVTGRDPGQRPQCRCAPSFDIGAVDTCIGGCVYCYSTRSHEAAVARHRAHDPDSPRL